MHFHMLNFNFLNIRNTDHQPCCRSINKVEFILAEAGELGTLPVNLFQTSPTVTSAGCWPKELDHACKQPEFTFLHVWAQAWKQGEDFRADCSSFMFKGASSTRTDQDWTPGSSLWRFSGHIHLGCDPEHWYYKSHLAWERLRTPKRSWRTWMKRRTPGLPYLACC